MAIAFGPINDSWRRHFGQFTGVRPSNFIWLPASPQQTFLYHQLS